MANSQQLQREQLPQNYQMSTGLLENLQIYLWIFLKAIEPHQMLLDWGSTAVWAARTWNSWTAAQHNEKAAIPHDGSEDGGRGEFLISNYTWTCSLSAECLLTSFPSFLPPHLFKKKESSCRQLLIKYLGFQLQLLYAHICSAINSFKCNWLIFHALGENIYDKKKEKASRVWPPASFLLGSKSCKVFKIRTVLKCFYCLGAVLNLTFQGFAPKTIRFPTFWPWNYVNPNIYFSA